MAKILTRLINGDVAYADGGKAFRRLMQQSPYEKRTTVITATFSYGYPPAIRLTKLDDSPMTITWSRTGQVDTFTEAGVVYSYPDPYSAPSAGFIDTVTIESEGPWLAGAEGVPLLSGKNEAHWAYTYPQDVILDRNCVGVSSKGLGLRMTDKVSSHKIFIPSSVRALYANAFVQGKESDTNVWRNTEIEFESAVPPMIEVPMLTYRENPVRIIVPAEGIATYASEAAFAEWIHLLVGRKRFSAGAALPEYSRKECFETEWYGDIECTARVTKVDADGTYYCKFKDNRQKTTIVFSTNGSRTPAVRLTKLDDAPLVITWEKNGQTTAFFDAGAVTNVASANVNATTSAPSSVTIVSEGPWLAGCGGLPLISGKDDGQWPVVYPQHVELDRNCVGSTERGLGFRFTSDWADHKLFIPRTVSTLGAKACFPYRLSSTGDAWSNTEVEFESVTPPVIEEKLFSLESPPTRIVVPADGISAYASEQGLLFFCDLIVGKKRFRAGDKLTDHHSGYFYATEWYSDIECTIPVSTVSEDGVYYCKLIGSVQKTTLSYSASNSSYVPTVYLTKSDNSPMLVLWSVTGEQFTFTDAGEVTCKSSGATANTSTPGTISILSCGKWKAGANGKPLLNSGGVKVKDVILDQNCTEVLAYGAGVRFDKYLTPHKIFIPSSVNALRANSCVVYDRNLDSDAWYQADFEFEAVTPPTIEEPIFWSKSPPVHIFVPADGIAAYMQHPALVAWTPRLVGKKTLAVGDSLPDCGNGGPFTTEWYSDTECTSRIFDVSEDGEYYCKLVDTRAVDTTTFDFTNTGYTAYLTFNKLDNSPARVAWKYNASTDAPAYNGVINAGEYRIVSPSKNGSAVFETHGPWEAGDGTWALITGDSTAGIEYVKVSNVVLGRNCVRVRTYGLGFSMPSTTAQNRIFIPDSVVELQTGAFWVKKGATTFPEWVNVEIEFESATVPVFGSQLFNPNILPTRIVVPAVSLFDYMMTLSEYSHLLVGKETLTAGSELPNYSTPEHPSCMWYRDAECTAPVTEVTEDGDYYCKLASYIAVDGVYTGPLSEVAGFVSANSLSDALCTADVDGMQTGVMGGELVAHYESFGFAGTDVVTFMYPY